MLIPDRGSNINRIFNIFVVNVIICKFIESYTHLSDNKLYAIWSSESENRKDFENKENL